MNEKALKTLEYYKIIEMLADCATSAPGRELCVSLRPSADISEIRDAQRETTDACSRIRMRGNISFGGTRDVSAALKRLEIGAVLSIAELLHIGQLLSSAAKIRSWGAHAAEEDAETEPDSLEVCFRGLDPMPSEEREVNRCILSEDMVADTASPELNRIRRQLKTVDERMRGELNSALSQYKSCLMDSVITIRDGSYCLPVKAEFKTKVPGVIHDQSSSGSTVFIEPMAAIRMNNERKELEMKEQREIAEILAQLSRLLAPGVDVIRENMRILTHLDFVFAKAKLSGQMSGSEPQFNTDGILEIKDGRHPLIPKHIVVPITIRLGTVLTS